MDTRPRIVPSLLIDETPTRTVPKVEKTNDRLCLGDDGRPGNGFIDDERTLFRGSERRPWAVFIVAFRSAKERSILPEKEHRRVIDFQRSTNALSRERKATLGGPSSSHFAPPEECLSSVPEEAIRNGARPRPSDWNAAIPCPSMNVPL